jgi:hypothetical protein
VISREPSISVWHEVIVQTNEGRKIPRRFSRNVTDAVPGENAIDMKPTQPQVRFPFVMAMVGVAEDIWWIGNEQEPSVSGPYIQDREYNDRFNAGHRDETCMRLLRWPRLRRTRALLNIED